MIEIKNDAAATAATPSLVGAIGHAVRTLRHARELSIVTLADIAGISSAMLSRIENGQTSASLTSLESLARALRVPITSLFMEVEHKSDATFIPPDGGLEIKRHGSVGDYMFKLLGHTTNSDLVLEPYLNEYSQTGETLPRTHFDGLKFIFMLEGKMSYQHGDTLYTLTPGASLYFSAQALHGPASIDVAPTKFISIQAQVHRHG